MIARFELDGQEWQADLSRPIDLSIPLAPGPRQPNCFFAPYMEAHPVRAGGFVGSTREGGPVNFFNVQFNPHGNGTHTECLAHITTTDLNIQQALSEFHFVAKLVSLWPVRQPNGDRLITESQLRSCFEPGEAQALIVRTMPNDPDKLHRQYSGTNPPYFDHAGIAYLRDCGLQHLLTDLPSLDKEEDGGRLLAHRAWWNLESHTTLPPRTDATITELIYASDEIPDGLYLLNLQIGPFALDATPSKPILFPLFKAK